MTERVRSLDRLRIDSPCTADWNSMIGNDQVRFCEHCHLHVTDLSTMTRSEARRLVARSKGRLCVRYVQRPDGGVLTKQIPEKLYRISRRVSRIAAGAFTATLSLSAAAAQTRSESNPQTVREQATIAEVIARPDLGATIAGMVTDPNGAMVAGATLTLMNAKDHVAFSYTTTDDGVYRFSFLTAGTYDLVVEAPTFARNEMRQLRVEENANRSEVVVMALPEILAEVEVVSTEIQYRELVQGGGAIATPVDPLTKAVFENDIGAVKELLSSTDINARDKATRLTALEHAVENGNLEIVRILLRAGADASAVGDQGQTVLMFLHDSATVELVRDLIAAGANVNAVDESGGTALMKAAVSSSFDVVKELIANGANMDARDESGVTVLMNAAENEDSNVVQILLKAGVDVSAKDENGNTALINAVRWGQPATVKALIEARVEINARDDDGKTALIYAAGNDDAQNVKALIEAGADVNARDDDQATPLMKAAGEGDPAIIKVLIDAGADINAKDEDGWTPLMYANDVENALVLLTAGADMTVRNNEGLTALGLARKHDHTDVAKLLESRGAPE